MQRVLCCVLCLLLILALAAPVSAADNSSAWVELLEYATVDNSGHNWFGYVTSADVAIPLPKSMRVAKVDMLITFSDGQVPTKIQVLEGSNVHNLTISKINGTTARVYGAVRFTLYDELVFRFTRSATSTAYVEILSCRVTPLVQQEIPISAQVLVGGTYYPVNHIIQVDGNGLSESAYAQIRIDIRDWQKYDTVTIWGSASTFALSSIRATINKTALPYELCYVESFPTGESTEYTYNYTYTENYSGGGGYGNGYGDTSTAVEFGGKILYSLIIDLSGVDRTLTHTLEIYLTGVYYGLYGYSFNCQYCSGNLIVPDTTEVTWWDRFTTFMTDLFAGSSDTPDKLEQVQEQSQELAEDRLGAVYQAGQVVDGLVGAFQNQTATEYLTVPVLTVPLGEVDWTIGGWEVQVVPDAFKPIVEILKTVIDIVCTLAFVKSMRARFERLLSGGNA